MVIVEEMQRSYEPAKAVFNMGISTLEKVHDILRAIIRVSAGLGSDNTLEVLPYGTAQHVKHRLIIQLFIQSAPLLNQKKGFKAKLTTVKNETMEWIDAMRDRIYNIELKWNKKEFDDGRITYSEGYSAEIEKELNNITLDIQLKLQQEGYFMPRRDDARYAWKE